MSNLPDGLSRAELDHIEGTLTLGEQAWEDLTEDERLEVFIEGNLCDDVAIVTWLYRNKPEVLWEAIRADVDLKRQFDHTKNRFVDDY